MGNYLSPNEQQLYQSIEPQFSFKETPYLLHKKTNQICTLHKITTHSQQHNNQINQIIEEYTKTRCESISKLKTHFYLDMRGYCSNQQNYYLIFKGKNNYTLRQEFLKRKYQQEIFTEEEIINIAQAYLNGLREYNTRFQRDFEQIWLHSLAVDQNGKVFLKDPWLSKDSISQGNSENISQLMLSYPSPQKLKAAFNSKVSDYEIFESNLFSVGAIALDLHRLDRFGSLYTKKQINFDAVRYKLNQINNVRLKTGLQCLLSLNARQRIKIYQIWGLDNKKQHFINVFANNKKTEKLQGNLQSINQDLTETRKKFNFAKNIPQTLVVNNQNRQNTRQTSPIRQTDSLWNNISPILYLKSDANQVVSTESFRIASPPTATVNTNVAQLSKISFKDSRQSNAIATGQAVSNSSNFSNPVTINSFIYNPQHKLIQKSAFKEPQYTINSVPKPFNRFVFHIKPGSVKPLNNINSNNHNTQPLTKNELSLISPISGTVYEQSFTFQQKKQQKANNQIAEDAQEHNFQGEVVNKKPIPQANNQQESKQQQKQNKHSQVQLINHQNTQVLSSTDEQQAASKTDTLVQAKKQQNETTPHRPPTKNKYNSTIVQVKDQESPDQSLLSQNTVQQQQEYVMQAYESGSRYQGFKSRGMRNGQGRFYYQDGGYYEGHWKNNKMDGIGKLYYENGNLAYEGCWSQDEFNGLGKVYNDCPISFKEPFDYTNFDLLGDYWQYYEGMLMKDTKEGRGKIKLCNGELFQGDFHHDRIQGFGKFHTLDGKIIEGIWREARLIKVINNLNRDN